MLYLWSKVPSAQVKCSHQFLQTIHDSYRRVQGCLVHMKEINSLHWSGRIIHNLLSTLNRIRSAESRRCQDLFRLLASGKQSRMRFKTFTLVKHLYKTIDSTLSLCAFTLVKQDWLEVFESSSSFQTV